MATTKAPLFGLDASGSLGGSIVFSRWRGRTYVRRLVTPKNPRSGLQIGMRSVLKFISQAFSSLSQPQKDAWDTLADVDNITQLNAQVRDASKRARINEGWRRGPEETPGTTPDAPTSLVVTALPKALQIAWTRPVGNQGDYTVAVYLSTTTAFTASVATLQTIKGVATVVVTIDKLTAGTEMFVLVRETNVDGELGTVSAEASGTPTA